MIRLAYYIFIFLLSSTIIHCQSIPGRLYPGCSLSGDHIYCYGGYTGTTINNGVSYTNTVNDVLELDLTPFNAFNNNQFDKSKIKWNNKSMNPSMGSVVESSVVAVSDGSILAYGGRVADNNTLPFSHYNPQSNTWNEISLPNKTYYIRTQAVNLGDDKIWIWGGFFGSGITQSTDMLFIYDYKTNTWPTAQPFTGNVSVDHTATLVNNHIYIIGGATTNAVIAQKKTKYMNNLNSIKTYNTVDGSWNSFTANGANPSGRTAHSTVATDDKKYLLIYGGSLVYSSRFQICTDVYYVYDIEKNNLQQVSLPDHPQLSMTTRFGHYSIVYKSNYLLLVFGYNDLNTPADSLNVLNIQNPYLPRFISSVGNDNSTNGGSTTINNTTINQSSGGLDLKTIIPAIVVPVVVVLVAGISIGLFCFYRHRQKRQKKAFQLVKEDPRKILENQDMHNNNSNGDSNTDESTVYKYGTPYNESKINASSPTSEDYRRSFLTDYQSNTSETDDLRIVVKPSDQEKIKPFSHTTIKPFEENPLKPSQTIPTQSTSAKLSTN
ncbi:unnamed protein product [Cunninghamella blakesleeana]